MNSAIVLSITDVPCVHVQTFIGQHEEYINEVINSPLVKFQVRLIKNYSHAGKDKYIFVSLMAKREHELKEKDIDE